MPLSTVTEKLLATIVGDSEAKGPAVDVQEAKDDDLAGGSPVEHENPLGYNVDLFTAVYLVISGVVGTGIFATPGSILKSMGSVGASYCRSFLPPYKGYYKQNHFLPASQVCLCCCLS
ncbi:hypothetical protein V1505DRAFT_35183 [Lipomyces doorenjongii]